jgi:hypothetical protein
MSEVPASSRIASNMPEVGQPILDGKSWYRTDIIQHLIYFATSSKQEQVQQEHRSLKKIKNRSEIESK